MARKRTRFMLPGELEVIATNHGWDLREMFTGYGPDCPVCLLQKTCDTNDLNGELTRLLPWEEDYPGFEIAEGMPAYPNTVDAADKANDLGWDGADDSDYWDRVPMGIVSMYILAWEV